ADREQAGEEALGAEVAVGELAGDEGGSDGADRAGEPEDGAHLGAGEAEPALRSARGEIARGKREPGAPDHVLEEHHQRETADVRFHRGSGALTSDLTTARVTAAWC